MPQLPINKIEILSDAEYTAQTNKFPGDLFLSSDSDTLQYESVGGGVKDLYTAGDDLTLYNPTKTAGVKNNIFLDANNSLDVKTTYGGMFSTLVSNIDTLETGALTWYVKQSGVNVNKILISNGITLLGSTFVNGDIANTGGNIQAQTGNFESLLGDFNFDQSASGTSNFNGVSMRFLASSAINVNEAVTVDSTGDVLIRTVFPTDPADTPIIGQAKTSKGGGAGSVLVYGATVFKVILNNAASPGDFLAKSGTLAGRVVSVGAGAVGVYCVAFETGLAGDVILALQILNDTK